jgi:hypothetical protein
VNTRRKFQAIGWGMLALLPLLLVCFFIYAGLKAGDTGQEKLSVLRQGEHTTATITSRKVWNYQEGDSLQIKYNFTLPSGQGQTGEYTFAYVPSGYDVGDKLEIAYDQKSPTVNMPVKAKGNEEDVQAITWFGIILFSLVACFISFLLGHKAWEAWRLGK